MRVAYPMRVDALVKPGGDLLQVLQYIDQGKKTLDGARPRFEGIVIHDLRADLSPFDLVHLTNIDRPVDTYGAFISARAAHKPIVVSPIHHSYREIERYERIGRGGFVGQISGLLGFTALEYLRNSIRSRGNAELLSPMLKIAFQGMRKSQHAILQGADKILVLSEKEKNDILYDFGEIPDDKFICLRNGLESSSSTPMDRDIDICVVGRIEARKNQIAVLQALNRLSLAGIFIGAENPNHKTYCRRFKEMIAHSPSTYRGSVSHEETLQIMRRSKVHVSASWFEVLSLVDLEAFCAGCGVVASSRGGTCEVLGDQSVYVNPESSESIANGIACMIEKMSGNKPDQVEARTCEPISETWDQVGDALYAIYRQSVGQCGVASRERSAASSVSAPSAN